MRKFLFVVTFCLVSLLSCSFVFSFSGCAFFPPLTNEEESKPKISFSVSEKTLTIGDEEYLTPIYDKMAGFTLRFESSDPTIVKVDNDGKISAEREGKATVKAIYESDSVRLEASLVVNCSFGGFLPELKTMGVSENVAITVDGSYVVLPYISFNGKEFKDATVTYSVQDDEVAEISTTGEITAKNRGETQVILKASWRGKDHTNTPTMQKVFNLSVIDDVRFFNDGAPILDETLYTLSEFDGNTYQNSIPCNFTVTINGETEVATATVENEDVVTMQGNELVAVGFGETYVLVEKEKNGITYSATFKIVVERIEKEISTTVPLFGTLDGTYLDVTTKEKKNVLAFIGDNAKVVDANQDGRALRVENGKIFGVESSSVIERGEAEIEVGTDTLIYRFKLETVAKAIVTAEELKVLELSAGEIVSGYFELMNDIDATNVTFNHVVSASYFNGTFNGNGYVISNLTLNANSSMFGSLHGSAIVKNFALVNLTATKSYFLAQDTAEDGLTISNVYIGLSTATQTPRGLTGRTGSNSVLKNVVIEYLGANAEQNRNYQERWTWQGLIGGMWTYTNTSDGKLYAQDKKWENVYVISPFVVSFRSDEKKDSVDKDKYAAIYGYGANETVDLYGNSANESVHNRDNPNLGDYIQTTEYYNAKYTNLYRYDNYSALKSAKKDYSSFDSKYWVEYDGRIAWKSIAVSQVSMNLYDGDQVWKEDTKIKTVGKELTVKAWIGESAISLSSVSVESNSYVTWNNSRKVLRVTSLPTRGDVKIQVTVSVKVGDVTVTKTLFVTVSSRAVTPIQPGGNYETGDSYDGYYGEVKDPIQSGGNYDAPDYGGNE